MVWFSNLTDIYLYNYTSLAHTKTAWTKVMFVEVYLLSCRKPEMYSSIVRSVYCGIKVRSSFINIYRDSREVNKAAERIKNKIYPIIQRFVYWKVTYDERFNGKQLETMKKGPESKAHFRNWHIDNTS